MPVWQMVMNIAEAAFNMTKNLPKSEDYGLISQIRRAANSIPANIAEAFGRESFKEKRHFYTIGKGSAYELMSHVLYGKRVKYFDEKLVNKFNKEVSKLIFDMSKIIKSLREKSNNPQP